MPDIFNSRPGMVAVITDVGGVVPGRIRLPSFQSVGALISGIEYEQATNQQFQTALDTSVYIYVFGDQMGAVKVLGKIIPSLCDEKADGLEEVFKFYANNRASRLADPIQVMAGAEVISGFLTGMSLRIDQLSESEFAPLYDYTLVVNTLPRKST
jgi:hypothetical protein